jgi:hypothetical protein
MEEEKNMHTGAKILEKMVLVATQAQLWYHACW